MGWSISWDGDIHHGGATSWCAGTQWVGTLFGVVTFPAVWPSALGVGTSLCTGTSLGVGTSLGIRTPLRVGTSLRVGTPRGATREHPLVDTSLGVGTSHVVGPSFGMGPHLWGGDTAGWVGPLTPPHLLLPLLGCVLGRQQGLAVGAALGREVHAGQRLLHQRHRQVHALDVQPPDEIPSLVHALHLHLNLRDPGNHTSPGQLNSPQPAPPSSQRPKLAQVGPPSHLPAPSLGPGTPTVPPQSEVGDKGPHP